MLGDRMYFIVKYNRFNDSREVMAQTEDAVEAYCQANMYDAKCKVGVDEDDVGEPGAVIQIENENGDDMWATCAAISCPPVGLFN
jgi:hypothetical protein